MLLPARDRTNMFKCQKGKRATNNIPENKNKRSKIGTAPDLNDESGQRITRTADEFSSFKNYSTRDELRITPF